MQESVVSVLRYIAQDNILRQSFYYGYRPTHLEGPTYGILGKGALSDTICVKSLHFSIITINGDILALVHVSGVNVDSGLEIEQDIWPNRKATEEDLKIISTIASPLKIEVLRYNRANTQLCFYTWTKYEQNDAFHELSGDVITYNDELYYCTTSKHEPRNIMIVDTETDYTPVDLDTSYKSIDKWPIIKQIAWTIYDKNGHPLFSKNFYLDDSFQVSDDFTSIYPFSRKPKHTAIKEFTYDLENCDIIVGHNIKYDVQVILSELYRLGLSTDYLANIKQFCTMKNSIDICGFETEWGNRFPKLQELYSKLFHRPFSNAHDAYYDVKATADCFWELIELNNNEQGNGFYDLYLDEDNQTATVYESTSMKSPYTMNIDVFCHSFKRSDELKPSSHRTIISHPYLNMDDE